MKTKSKSSSITKESPIILEKLLTGKSPLTETREPKILASPNAFDWEKRLAMNGSSPNAFVLSLNGTGATDNQLFDYPRLPQEHPCETVQQADFSTILLMDHMVALAQEQEQQENGDSSFNLLSEAGVGIEQFSDSTSSMSGGRESLLNPLPSKRSNHDRRDSHRESERRRRESFKNAMCDLEHLVLLTINRVGSFDVLGKGPNRKLAHAEIYRLARDIIVTLKEEIAKVNQINQELAYKLQN